MGLMGHPIADAYQSMLTEKVEVLRGPASVLYGSNAMGGVINIVTRKQQDEGVRTNMQVGYGSYQHFADGIFQPCKERTFQQYVHRFLQSVRTDTAPDMEFE